MYIIPAAYISSRRTHLHNFDKLLDAVGLECISACGHNKCFGFPHCITQGSP